MIIQPQKSEKGQAIVVIVGGLIAMFALVALAIDGGMILYDRRSAQNAADAAALAGAFEYARDPWRATSTLSSAILSVAGERAHDNHYGITDGKIVTITYSPNPLPSSPGPDKPVLVTVKIQSNVKTSFLQLIYPDPVQNTVEATSRAIPPSRSSPFGGSGIVSLAPNGCDGIKFNGNLMANLVGGGLYVNSDDPSCALNGPSGSYFVFSPFVKVVGGISSNIGSSNLIVPPGGTTTGYSPALPYPPGIGIDDPPGCSGTATIIASGQQHDGDVDSHGNPVLYDDYSPGTISNNTKSLGNMYFKNGTYCITGGFDLNSSQYIRGENVIFYVDNTSPCNFTWNAGATIRLTGASGTPHANQWLGLLMYISYKNNNLPWRPDLSPMQAPSFNGTIDSFIQGSIYAPTCNIQMNGTGGNFYRGQMIGYTVELSGNNTIFLDYNASQNIKVQDPAYEDLYK